MNRESKAFKSKASHLLVQRLVTLPPIAYCCSQYGPEFFLLSFVCMYLYLAKLLSELNLCITLLC